MGLIAEIYEKTSPDCYHHYQLVKKSNAANDVIEHLQLVFIELPKFPVQSPHEKKLRLLWLRFLREIDEKTRTVSTDLLEIPEIAQAVALSEEAAYTLGELDVYESYWDQVRREKTLLIDSDTKGQAEGEAIGEAKLNQERRTIAKNLLKQGIDLELVITSTGLSHQEIEDIQKGL